MSGSTWTAWVRDLWQISAVAASPFSFLFIPTQALSEFFSDSALQSYPNDGLGLKASLKCKLKGYNFFLFPDHGVICCINFLGWVILRKLQFWPWSFPISAVYFPYISKPISKFILYLLKEMMRAFLSMIQISIFLLWDDAHYQAGIDIGDHGVFWWWGAACHENLCCSVSQPFLLCSKKN